MRLQRNTQWRASTNATPLLWFLRDQLRLVGTKYGCGIAQCGACTVHLNGNPVRSCSLPLSAAVGQQITTIEGLAGKDGRLHPLQSAWIEHDVPQCGYCRRFVCRETCIPSQHCQQCCDSHSQHSHSQHQ